MSGPDQIADQPGSPVDSQHKRLHHIRSERPGTGHQLAERPAERDIAHSLPSSYSTWSSTSTWEQQFETAAAAKGQIWLPRATRWFLGKPGSTVVHRQWARLPAPVFQNSGSCDPAACGSLLYTFLHPQSLCTQPSSKNTSFLGHKLAGS